MDHNPDYSYCNILQWNTQGIQNKKDELLDIINKHKIDVIVVQETKTWENYNFSLPNYNCFFLNTVIIIELRMVESVFLCIHQFLSKK